MNTPIADFVRGYEKKNIVRLHMPGHKGKSFVGCEAFDITEVAGADALYEADGIIAESEANAAKLFGTGKTVYATEGSSQCIRAMLYLALINRKVGTNPLIVAARNAHKSFVFAAALSDIEVAWLWPERGRSSLCSCQISPKSLEETLQGLGEPPLAVYVTSPDYLGGRLDIRALADICHRYHTILMVDNAHGAYLHFLNPGAHPMDLGADICCDSAHKTLPVLTGGAYLHISKNAPEGFLEHAKSAMALFGSTSPSYLILSSLDLCNAYLAKDYRQRLLAVIQDIQILKTELKNAGWEVKDTDELKLTVRTPKGMSGKELAKRLRLYGIECEYADPEYVVCMITPENAKEDFIKVKEAIGENEADYAEDTLFKAPVCKREMSIREAVFAEHEELPVEKALGRICGTPAVSCPPAIPIVISGERIDEDALELFTYYGIQKADVVK